jgi:secreted trypsin-like serine protease
MLGYGITRDTVLSDNGLLRYVEDVKAFPENEESTQRHWLLAGEMTTVTEAAKGINARGACPGDSGSPALKFENDLWVQYGVLSLGELGRFNDKTPWFFCLATSDDDPSTKPGNYYTDIRQYSQWIASTLLTF